VYPLYSFAAAGIFYFGWANAQFYELSRRHVVRLDLLPHLEMVSVQRVGAFGILYNKLIRI